MYRVQHLQSVAAFWFKASATVAAFWFKASATVAASASWMEGIPQ
jgi:hypothetical protein